MCMTRTGTRSHLAPVGASLSFVIPRAEAGGAFAGEVIMTNASWSWRAFACLLAKPTEGCLSIPPRLPSGRRWVFRREDRRAAPKGAGPSTSIRRGGAIPRRNRPGSISWVFHPSGSPRYRSLYRRMAELSIYRAPIESEPRQLSLPFSWSWLGGQND